MKLSDVTRFVTSKNEFRVSTYIAQQLQGNLIRNSRTLLGMEHRKKIEQNFFRVSTYIAQQLQGNLI